LAHGFNTRPELARLLAQMPPMPQTVNVAEQFTRTPGARYKTDGKFSGELFREQFLEPFFENSHPDAQLTIVLDGTEGFATSFLEEAFGGLARKYGAERSLKKLVFVSEEDPLLITEIRQYMETCR
jgi:hypothetical protein